MGALYEIMDFIGFIMGSFFQVLDNVYLGDYSILDIQIAIAFFGITTWFIFRVLDNKGDEASE